MTLPYIDPNDDTVFTIDDLAAYLRTNKATIYSMRNRHQGPAAFKVGRELRWRKRDVDCWIAAQAVQP